MRRGLFFGLLALAAFADDLPRGQIIDDVKCAADPTQSYALYIPSNYMPKRAWSAIFALDPRGRGRVPVERFQQAAEMYGYIVAGSNNSRNGSWEGSMTPVQAMSTDIGQRFSVDAGRVYTAGLSGGARLAAAVALNGQIAGVIASSAGTPDGRPRKSLPFALFGTAGTEDFNYLEMIQLDRVLTTPHRVRIFEGGHTWLSSDLAREALEWMEIESMKSGRRTLDEALVDKIFASRREQVAKLTSDRDTCLALEALAEDFKGLKDVSEFTSRAAELRRQKAVKDALKKDRSEEEKEEKLLAQITHLEGRLGDAATHSETLMDLKDQLTSLAKDAKAPQDSSQRRLARRVLRGTLAGAAGVKDAEYQKLLAKFRPGNWPPG